MPTILVTGPAHSGKTSVAAGLLTLARDAGLTSAYFKPFSADEANDADHAFASAILAETLGITFGPAPLPAAQASATEGAANTIAQLRGNSDLVIVELAAGAPVDDLATVDARVLEVLTYAPETDWAAAADQAAGRWGTRLTCLVVNAVPLYQQETVAASVAQSSAEVDAAVIPESRVMLAPTVAQVAEHLDAVWTLDPINADAPVERFLIGGNIMDNGPTYYGRYANQAVITRTQRPDIQLASMLPQTRCLVLTGPGEPTEYVKAEAMERDIPLLQVFSSTIETADALDRIIEASTSHSLGKARHYAALLQQHAGAETLDGWLA